MRLAPLALAAALLLSLAGCVPTTHPSASPRASATPVFASDAEALAAAEKAYAAYLKVSAEITQEGGVRPERIDRWVTAEQAPRERDAYAYFKSHDLHTSGFPTFSPPKLEQVSSDALGSTMITFYTCVDATQVRVLDAHNTDVTPSNRADRAPLEITVVSGESKSDLVIAESSQWSGPGVCS